MHLHVVPRWKGDTNFMPVLGDTRVLAQSLEDSWTTIHDALRRREKPDDGDRPRHLQGLRRPRAVSEPDRRGRRLRRRRARSRGCSPTCAGARGQTAAGLHVAVGHDMRRALPRARRALRRGLVDEGVHVLDIGMVGPRWSITRSARASSTAACPSRPPTTRRPGRASSSCARGRSRCRATAASRTCAGSRRAKTSRARPARAAYERRDIYEEFHRHVLGFIDPLAGAADAGGARRRQRHGGNDGRADPRPFPLAGRAPLLRAQRAVPRPRAQPAAGGEPQADHRDGARGEGRARHRLGRRRRPLLLHRRDRGVRPGRLPDRAAGGVDAREGSGRHDPLRRPSQPGRAGHRQGRRRRRRW